MNKVMTKFIHGCSVFILLYMLASCTEKKREFPVGCDLGDLLLNLSDLPESSEFSSSGEPLPDSTINSAGSTFYLASHLIDHSIFWYAAEKYSIRKYEEEVVAAELVNMDKESAPTDLMANALLADNYKIVCGDDVQVFRCIYVGRYEGYVTVLNAEIAEDAISLATYNKLIEVVDKKLMACK